MRQEFAAVLVALAALLVLSLGALVVLLMRDDAAEASSPSDAFVASLDALDRNDYEAALALVDAPCRNRDSTAAMAEATTYVHGRGMSWRYALPVREEFFNRGRTVAVLWLAPNLPGIPSFAFMHRVNGVWLISCMAALEERKP